MTISTYNTGMFATVAHYDTRRLQMVTALKQQINSDIFCQNEMWYKQDLDLLLADDEWITRYPYLYTFNNDEMTAGENGKDLPSLCPTETMPTLLKLIGQDACQQLFKAATNITGKGYEDLRNDLFSMLDCWKTNDPELFNSVYDDKACYGCLINVGTTGNIAGMINCMKGSSATNLNDQAYESFLYGLALWSKFPMNEAAGNEMTWNVVPRGYLSANFESSTGKVGIICTHVGVEGPEQQDQFAEITQFVEIEEDKGIADWILAGDLNCGPKNADNTIQENPDREQTNGVSSMEVLSYLGWWDIYSNCLDTPMQATWNMPTKAMQWNDGNTNICGHDTGIDCSTLGENDERDMLLDHIMVRGDNALTDPSKYKCNLKLNSTYNGNHISDHYAIHIEIL
eukprot:CFRG8608T1